MIQRALLAAFVYAHFLSAPMAAEMDYITAADRVANLALKICLAGGSETSITIAGKGDSLDVKGAPGTITVKKTEAQVLVGGLSPAMTRFLAEQTSEARACSQAQYSALSQKLWVAAGSSTRQNTSATSTMVRYINGDQTETTIIGQVPFGHDIVLCIQQREPDDAGDEISERPTFSYSSGPRRTRQ